MSDITRQAIAPSDVPGGVVTLNGILARAREQYLPLSDVLTTIGPVVGFDYVPHSRMDMAELITQASNELAAALTRGRGVLVGSSLGGMQVPFVIDAIRRHHQTTNLSPLKIVIVDAPTGAETLKALPDVAAGLMASPLARSALDSRFGYWLVNEKMSDPPKYREITVPSRDLQIQLSGKSWTDRGWKEWVMRTGEESLKGYSGLLWWSWIESMIRMGRDGSLEQAIASLRGLDVTYLSCAHPGNGVVAQPQAAEWWAKRVPGLEVIEVYGTHCGYLQNAPEFREAFQRILTV